VRLAGPQTGHEMFRITLRRPGPAASYRECGAPFQAARLWRALHGAARQGCSVAVPRNEATSRSRSRLRDGSKPREESPPLVAGGWGTLPNFTGAHGNRRNRFILIRKHPMTQRDPRSCGSPSSRSTAARSCAISRWRYEGYGELNERAVERDSDTARRSRATRTRAEWTTKANRAGGPI